MPSASSTLLREIVYEFAAALLVLYATAMCKGHDGSFDR